MHGCHACLCLPPTNHNLHLPSLPQIPPVSPSQTRHATEPPWDSATILSDRQHKPALHLTARLMKIQFVLQGSLLLHRVQPQLFTQQLPLSSPASPVHIWQTARLLHPVSKHRIWSCPSSFGALPSSSFRMSMLCVSHEMPTYCHQCAV